MSRPQAGVLHFVVPQGIDDPRQVSGGNRYDQHLADGLRAAGRAVSELALAGAWPEPSAGARVALARAIGNLPRDAPVLLDGLLAPASAAVLALRRDLRLVVLLHMPLAPVWPQLAGQERAVLARATQIIVPSAWVRDWVVRQPGAASALVTVAAPGVDSAPCIAGSVAGGRLLCVAAVAPHKGHDLLVDALARLADLEWTCTCAGSLAADPPFAGAVQRRVLEDAGLAARVRFAGVLQAGALEQAWSAADMLVLASRHESYGMVVAEALAHGLPVVATAAGGISEALGVDDHGEAPGLLVPPGDSAALAGALRAWLEQPALRARLRVRAAERRAHLPSWDATLRRVVQALQRGGV